jgi:hypothetical protein
MKLLRLNTPVTITGPDFFGRDSLITFQPTRPHKPGFHWKYDPSKPAICISEEIASTEKRRVVLKHDGHELNVWEHIATLRWSGLDGIEIISPAWPPYHGRTRELYRSLDEYMVRTDNEMRWCSVNEEIFVSCPDSHNRYTWLIPSEKPQLDVRIICDYPGLGKHELQWSWPENLMPAFSTHTQGWPKWWYYPAKLAGIFSWPHANKTTWPQDHKNGAIEKFALHRLLDLLGGITLIHPSRFFAGTIISHCSGHWADIKAVKMAQSRIQLLD